MTAGPHPKPSGARLRSLATPPVLLAAAACTALLGAAALLFSTGRLAAPAATSAPAPCASGTGAACSAPEGRLDAEALELPRGKPLLLEFGSEHCAACARMAPLVAELEARCAKDAGVVVHVEVDDPRGEALAARYGVRFLPTFLTVDASGVEVERVVGEQPRARLAGLLTDVRGAACPATL